MNQARVLEQAMKPVIEQIEELKKIILDLQKLVKKNDKPAKD